MGLIANQMTYELIKKLKKRIRWAKEERKAGSARLTEKDMRSPKCRNSKEK